MIQELDVERVNSERLIRLAQEELQLQRREVKRLRSLAGNRVVSDSQLDQAIRAELDVQNSLLKHQNQIHLLKTRRNRLEQAVELSSAKLEQAKLDETRTKVTAPIDAMVVDDTVEQDSYVQSGAPLVLLEDVSTVEVKCNLRMDQLYWIWQQGQETPAGPQLAASYQIPSTPATVVYQLGPRRYQWQGQLSRYDGIGLDEKTRTVPCRVVVADPRQVQSVDQSGTPTSAAGVPALVRGMYVSVAIHARPQTALLKLPQTAVQPGNVIWLVENGHLRRRPVRVSLRLRDTVLVEAETAGFAAGARVVERLPATAVEGMAVQEASSS
jgi:hypothetical protein